MRKKLIQNVFFHFIEALGFISDSNGVSVKGLVKGHLKYVVVGVENQ